MNHFEEQTHCSVCRRPHGYDDMRDYPGYVCHRCDERALDQRGRPAKMTDSEDGPNPVYVDGIKCWRRYRFGGFVTMQDRFDCETLAEFDERQWSREPEQGGFKF